MSAAHVVNHSRFPMILPSPAEILLLEQKQHQQILHAATSDNTRRAYRSAVQHFLAWGGLLPTNESTLVRYLMAFADSLNVRTLSLRLTALAQWHKQQNFPDPTSTATVRKTLQGLSRLHGKPKKKASALALQDVLLMVEHLNQLQKNVVIGDTSLQIEPSKKAIKKIQAKALRDNALLQIGFFGCFRRSELTRLRVEDVLWQKEGILITLPRSKTDQTGEGITKAIPFGKTCCPALALKNWLLHANIVQGPVFRQIDQWGHVGSGALNPASVNMLLKQLAIQVGLTADQLPRISSHSLRRGMATSASKAGASFKDIKRQGGWRHDGTVHGYIEEASQFQENAASHLLG